MSFLTRPGSVLPRPEVFRRLAEAGAARAEVHFSGGNDEGGVDSIEFLDADGTVILQLEEYYAEQVYDRERNRYVEKRPPTDQELLVTALCEPVYNKYHGFAGEFYVSGKIIWSVAEQRVTMDAQETVDAYEDIDEEL